MDMETRVTDGLPATEAGARRFSPAPRPRVPASPLPADDQGAYPVEFAGWLPCFTLFGDCGRHPLFAHTRTPPEGYRFIRSQADCEPNAADRGSALDAAARRLYRAVRFAFRSAVSLLGYLRRTGVGPNLRALAAAGRLLFGLYRAGCPIWPTLQFLATRHLPSQVLLPRRPRLLFLTSFPFTFGQHPWVVEIEDVVTLLYPFHRNGQTSRTPIRRSPCLPVVKALLESDSCRGIVTHMRSTAEALPRLFRSEIVAAKTAYIPCGTALPAAGQEHAAGGPVNLLFTCSWHQDPESFFVRGGLDLLESFKTLKERYPRLRLTLRTRLPALEPCFRRILEKCWVRVIDRRLTEDEMEELMRETHLFLLPAARIHVVSVLRAMAHGQVVVVSDGWGFREYVEHGRNGLVVPGRYGKASWMDDDGMLREDYAPLYASDPAVTRGLVEAVSALVEDHELRRRLGRQARQDVATRHTLENWNRGLKEALDSATRRLAPDPRQGGAS